MKIATGIMLALVLAGCSSGTTAAPAPTVTVAVPGPTVTVTAQAPAPATPPAADPYAAYLAANPDPSLVLTPEDAQARALLGCGQAWAPGTIDAVLAEAYKGLCPQ